MRIAKLRRKPRPRRAWCYAYPPRTYEMAVCKRCGNNDAHWSEFAEHLWCPHCHRDFIPEHAGIFDGPIPMGACELMGIRFDRVNLKTLALECFDPDSFAYFSPLPAPESFAAPSTDTPSDCNDASPH